MDQNLIPYRSFLTAKERASFSLFFTLGMVLFSAALLSTFAAGILFFLKLDGFYNYSLFLFPLGLVLLIPLSIRKLDHLENSFYKSISLRMGEKLLMEHGLVPVNSLPELGKVVNFFDLDNRDVKGIIYISSAGTMTLHRLVETKEN